MWLRPIASPGCGSSMGAVSWRVQAQIQRFIRNVRIKRRILKTIHIYLKHSGLKENKGQTEVCRRGHNSSSTKEGGCLQFILVPIVLWIQRGPQVGFFGKKKRDKHGRYRARQCIQFKKGCQIINYMAKVPERCVYTITVKYEVSTTNQNLAINFTERTNFENNQIKVTQFVEKKWDSQLQKTSVPKVVTRNKIITMSFLATLGLQRKLNAPKNTVILTTMDPAKLPLKIDVSSYLCTGLPWDSAYEETKNL
ncbi:hypothetical protein ABEB36_015227 [Hypothenemus hampei]|uniref:Uncharacterized protein n=1 Tax=Hypothenemus hampei TaxID=57062 RepID=A0ABD1E0R6_HYPHA